MIHLEAWHMEVASFEREREILYQQYSRGEISAEEFANRMLRFWKADKGEGGLLEVSEDGGLFVTPEWLYAHAQQLQEIHSLWQRWRNEVAHYADDRYISPRAISQNFFNGEILMSEVQDVRTLLTTEPKIGDDVTVTYSFFEGQGWKSEQDFDRWFQYTLDNARRVVEALEADE